MKTVPEYLPPEQIWVQNIHIDRMSDQELKNNIISYPTRMRSRKRIVNELIAYMVDLDLDRFEQQAR